MQCNYNHAMITYDMCETRCLGYSAAAAAADVNHTHVTLLSHSVTGRYVNLITISVHLHDSTSLQMQPLDRMAVILGEFGVPDHGKPTPPQSPAATAAAEGRHLEANNSFPANGDFSSIADVDVTFLQDLAEYLRGLEVQGATVSWFWWAWNANSGTLHSTCYVCFILLVTVAYLELFLVGLQRKRMHHCNASSKHASIDVRIC
jgi:hypothetical protein